MVASRGLAQRDFPAIAAALNEAFGLDFTAPDYYGKYKRIADGRETASPVKVPVSEAEVAVALDAKQSAETHLAGLAPRVAQVLKARAAALAAGDDADDVLAAGAEAAGAAPGGLRGRDERRRPAGEEDAGVKRRRRPRGSPRAKRRRTRRRWRWSGSSSKKEHCVSIQVLCRSGLPSCPPYLASRARRVDAPDAFISVRN